MRTVAIDFDGTVFDPRRRAVSEMGRRFILAALRDGYRVVIHSCRCNPLEVNAEDPAFWWNMRAEMINVLDAGGFLAAGVELWDGPGKPLAQLYVDDRAEPPDWDRLARELGLPLANGPKEPGAMGDQGRKEKLVIAR